MKKRFALLLTTLSLAISGCSILIERANTVEYKTNVYSLINDDDVINFDNNPGQEITYRAREGEELNPYFTISDYLSMLDPIKKPDYEFNVQSLLQMIVVTIKRPEGSLFVAQINPYSHTVVKNGNFSSALTTERDLTKTSLNLRMNETYEMVKSGNDVLSMDYKKAGYRPFSQNNKVYFPLSLLERIFSEECDIHHVFNYKRIIQFKENEDLSNKQYIVDGGEPITSNQEMKNYINDVFHDEMPEYLLKDRLATINFIMENQYGLKSTWGVDSMVNYLSKQSFYDDFLSTNATTRYAAFYKMFAYLDDGHTSPRDAIDSPWARSVEVSPYGPKVAGIYTTRAELNALRTLTPGQVYYSSDNKLAFFSFDSFTFANEAFNDDGSEKTTLSDYDSSDYDTFFYVAKMLQEIKNKGAVEDVVVDISINGGGTVGVLLKLLPLFTKNNNAEFYLRTDILPKVVQKYYISCDSNGDGEYKDDDCFGNDFKFHILTSGFSFSCGNAFPFVIQKMGVADIIGVTSGGGECAVSECYLPSGEHFYRSGAIHFGWFKDDNFVGDEGGAPVDKNISYADFYNLEHLQQVVRS